MQFQLKIQARDKQILFLYEIVSSSRCATHTQRRVRTHSPQLGALGLFGLALQGGQRCLDPIRWI